MQFPTSPVYFTFGGLLPRPGTDGPAVFLGAFGVALLAEYMVLPGVGRGSTPAMKTNRRLAVSAANGWGSSAGLWVRALDLSCPWRYPSQDGSADKSGTSKVINRHNKGRRGSSTDL